MRNLRVSSGHRHQQGAVLIICLVLLLAVTMIGVTTMDTTNRETKMAMAMADTNQAFEAAELALAEAEATLIARTSLPDPSADGSTGVWERDAPGDDQANWWESNDADWWDDNGLELEDSNFTHAGLDTLQEPPRYVLEWLRDTSDSLDEGSGARGGVVTYVRITARGVGAREGTVVLLQSVFAKRFD